TIIFVIFTIITEVRRDNPFFVILISFPAIVYLLIINYNERNNIQLNQSYMIFIWFISILLRILQLFYPVGLSDDIYRYIWNGEMHKQGINPYTTSPNDPKVDNLYQPWWTQINHPNITSPYPPVAQFIFSLLAVDNLSISQNILLYQVVIILFDLGVIRLLNKILQHLQMPSHRIIIYAYSPLVIFEFAGNAHIDVIAIFFTFLSYYFILKKHKTISAICITIAILIKILPILLLLILFRYYQIKDFLISFIVTILFIIPYIEDPISVLVPDGLIIFSRYFRFNESIYRIFHWISIELFQDEIIARYIFAFGIILISSIIFKQAVMEDYTIVRQSYWLIFLVFLISPDIQPWYIIWIIPLFSVYIDNSGLIWSITVLFSYFIYLEYDSSGIWIENPLILLIEYTPVYLLLLNRINTTRIRNKSNEN
ncbi:MAG: glycosyltransferase 87 family protein, partial [Candidatus Heimdallarchaeota archaeon]|nr:glycosyltransferase 87 family protein [Candidatus Heimdallarchaeota archaeon]